MEQVELTPVDLAQFNREEDETKTEADNLLRGSIDFSSTTVNYFEVDEHSTAGFTLTEDKTPLQIVDYGPAGPLPAEMRRPEVHVLFNQPMVPLSRLGKPMEAFDGLSLNPPLKGTYRWYGSKLLSFQAAEPLTEDPDGFPRTFQVTVKGSMESLGGKELGEDFSFSFMTEDLKMVNLIIPGSKEGTVLGRTSNVPLELARTCLLRFNMPVEPASIAQGLSVQVDGKEPAFSVVRPETLPSGEPGEDSSHRLQRTVRVELGSAFELQNEQTVDLTLQEGAQARPDTPPVRRAQSRSYSTLRDFEFRYTSRHSYAFPGSADGNRYPIYLSFSQPIDPSQDLAALLSISLDTPLTGKVKASGSTIRITGLPVEPGDTYQVAIPAGLRDVYGQKLKNGPVSEEVTVPDAQPYIRFPDQYRGRRERPERPRIRYLEKQFDPALIVEHQNAEFLSYGFRRASSLLKPGSDPVRTALDLRQAPRSRAAYEVLDLTDTMGPTGAGTVRFLGSGTYPSPWNPDQDYTRHDDLMVQVTDIGLTVRYGYNRILVWANSLTDGSPVKGAQVRLYTHGRNLSRRDVTDSQGLAVFSLEPGEFLRDYQEIRVPGRDRSFWVAVEKDGDKAEMEVYNTQHPGRYGVSPSDRPEHAEETHQRILLFSDRQLYKPGEEVSFRGIHWKQQLGEFTPYQGSHSLSLVSLRDREAVWSSSGKTSSSGGFYGTFRLPEDVKPGDYALRYRVGSLGRSARVKVAHFRRLNFSVASRTPDRTFYAGDTLSIPVKASYLSGGDMPGASYSYFWTRRAAGFQPPGKRWEPYRFGLRRYTGSTVLDEGSGSLSAAGEARIKQEASNHEISGAAYRYILETTVTDADNQQVSSSAGTYVHPAEFYIGARFGRGASTYWSRFIPSEEDSPVSLALVTPDGSLYGRPAEIQAELVRNEWKASYQQGVYDRVNVSYTKTEKVVQEDIITVDQETGSLDSLPRWTVNPEKAGSYQLRLTARDSQGRKTQTELSFYAYGGHWAFHGSDQDTIELVPDKDLYFAGDTARIMVQSPRKAGRYLLTVEREGIIEERIVTLDEDSSMIEIPIQEEYLPRVYVALSSYTNRQEKPKSYYEPDLGQPRSLFGAAELDISPKPRELDIEVVSDQESYRPGRTAQVKIKVTRGGEPVAGAEVIYLAVDRGVVDLVNYHVPNPLQYFYSPAHFPLCTAGDDLREYLMKPVTYDTSALRGGGGAKLEERKDFNPLAAFKPALTTNAQGIAEVSVELPDTLTTYRSTAIALEQDRIGYSEDELYVKNPVNIRTAFPRRLRLRDSGVGDVVVQNNTGEEQEVTLSVEADGLGFPGEAEKTVTVPPKGVYTVPFLMVPREKGEAKVRIRVESSVLREILHRSMEVELPRTTEAFTVTGTVDREDPGGEGSYAEEGLMIPENIQDGYGSYSVEMYASRMGMLRGPVKGLRDYTHYTLVSRMYHHMPDALLGKTLESLDLPWNRDGAERVLRDLKSRQTDGGWIRWSERQTEQDRYLDTLALYCAHRGRVNGLAVPQGLSKGLSASLAQSYRESMEKEGLSPAALAYGTYILQQTGTDITPFLPTLLESKDSLGLTGYAYTVLVLLEDGQKRQARDLWQRARNLIRLDTRTIDINETYETRWYFDSEIRQIASLAWASLVIGDDPEIRQRFTTTLEQRLSASTWKSRTDQLWTLVAMKAYADHDRIENLDMTASFSLDGEPQGSKEITGLQDSRWEKSYPLFEPPLGEKPRGELLPLKMKKEGRGNLYYNSTLKYALPSEMALPRDEGISVFVQYETLDGETVDAKELQAGTTYRVRLSVSTSRRRSYLTLDVPLPSGMEIVDPSFATTGSYANEGGSDSEVWTRETSYGDTAAFSAEGAGSFDWRYGSFWWYWRNEPDLEVYDNHLTYYWDTFYEGKRELTFLARATSPGVYPTPPAEASLMYQPEVFGRNGGRLFVIR